MRYGAVGSRSAETMGRNAERKSVEKRVNGTFFEEAFWIGRVPFCKVIPGISKDIVLERDRERKGIGGGTSLTGEA